MLGFIGIKSNRPVRENTENVFTITGISLNHIRKKELLVRKGRILQQPILRRSFQKKGTVTTAWKCRVFSGSWRVWRV